MELRTCLYAVSGHCGTAPLREMDVKRAQLSSRETCCQVPRMRSGAKSIRSLQLVRHDAVSFVLSTTSQN